jgi:uncharacterized repeat protein (TIGR01451 family)/CSLREA domain-containing protein
VEALTGLLGTGAPERHTLAQLQGSVTAFTRLRGPDGGERLAVGLGGTDGAVLQVLARQGDALVPVETERLEGEATQLAVGELDGDGVEDVAVLAGGQVSVLRGVGGLERMRFGFQVRALALGAFLPDRDPRAQLALLDTEGSLHLAAHGDFEGSLRDARPDPRLRGRPPASKAEVAGFAQWRVLERFEHLAAPGSARALLLRTRISPQGGDDLAVYDSDRAALSVVSHTAAPERDEPFAPGEVSIRDEPSAPVAAVPVRVSADPRPGLVMLARTGVVIAPALPNPTITVNSVTDATSATLINNCLAGSGTCSLRAAVQAANQRAGADTIQLPAGTYTLTLAGTDEDAAATGDLDVTDALTLNGAGASSTLIQAGTTNANGIDKVMSINPSLTQAFATVLSNVTLRYGFNHSTVANGGGYGGALDWDGAGSGTLTLTNCVVSDNQTTDGDGGGIFTSNSTSVNGSALTLNGVTFANNVARKGTPGASGIGGALEVGYLVQLTVNGGTFTNNQAPQSHGEGGAIYLFESGGAPQSAISDATFSSNQAGVGGGAIRSGRGLDITRSTFTANAVSGGTGGALSLSALSETSHLTLSTIASNSATVSGGGLIVTNGGPLDMHYNRVALNTAGTGANFMFQGTGALTANENWWACNQDPSSAACDKVVGVSSAQVSPYLRVTPSASPASVQMGDSLTVTGSMVKDSSGTAQSLANLATLVGLPVAFQNAQNAQVVSSDTALSSSLTAQATLTATAAGQGSVDIVVDGEPAPASFTVVGPDLTLTKTDAGDFEQGASGVAYTLTVTNAGGGRTDTGLSGGHPVVVTDTLPAGLTFVSSSGTAWSCSGTTTVTCSHGQTLEAGQAAPAITLKVNVSTTAPTPLPNTATVSGGGEEASKTGNNSATDNTSVRQFADLTVSKSHAGNFRQGQSGAQYLITVHDARFGATDGSAVTVVDALPAGLSATAFSGAGWSCDLPTLTCTSTAVVAAGSDFPALTLTVDVADDAPVSLVNTVTVGGGGELITDNDGASDPTTVDQVADLTVSKSHTGSFRQGQSGASYAIAVHNVGPGPTLGTTIVVDSLPAGLTATAASGTGWSCTVSAATATCTSSQVVASGADFPGITLTVDVADDAPPSVTNSVTVSGGGEIATGNDSATDPTTVVQVADLTVTKSHAGSFRQGDAADSYALTVSNTGPGPTVGTVTLVDTLPAGLTATGMSGTGWSCDVATATCVRSDVLAAGSSYPTVTLTVAVASNAPASVTNLASVSGGGELNTGNDAATDPTNITQVADLTVTKSHAGSFRQGDTGRTYTLSVGNSGPGPTAGTVTLVDTLPVGLTATGMSGTGWTCVLGTLTCTRVDALAPGGSYPDVTVTVDVDVDAPATVTNAATVSGGGELNTANDTASDPTTLIQVADLTVTKSHVGTFTQGQSDVTYTLTVHNGGPGATEGTTTVTDTLPAGLTATSMSGTGWTCVLGTLTCTRSDVLVSGADYPAITLTANVSDTAGTPLVNTATVSGGGELVTSNDTASDSAAVTQLADLTLTKSHTGSFSQSQTGAEYTLIAHNAGNGATDGTAVTVVDTLPTGLAATAMSGTGWTCDLGTLTCTRTDVLAAGADYPAITLTVDVAADAPSSVTNTASVSGGGELITGNDDASDPTSIVKVADLTLTKSHAGSFRQGQTGASYTLIVSNGGDGATVGTVTLVDVLPAGLSAAGMSGTGWTCDLPTTTCTRADALAAGASYPPVTLLVDVATDAPASLTNTATVSGGGERVTSNDSASDPTTVVLVADLTVSKTHAGTFAQGQTGAQYVITVTNSGAGPTVGAITVQDALPAGLTATGMAGTGWSCTTSPLACTTNAVLAQGSAAPAITVTVDVASDAPASLTNSVTVSGGGELDTTNDTATDVTAVTQFADLTLTKSHTQTFSQGDVGATYALVVHNAGAGDSTGSVTVVDTLPTGLTATAMAGTGWSCTLATLTCARTDVLASGADFPAITLTVDVAADAPAQVTNTATVSGGGELITSNDGAADPTTIGQRAELTLTKIHAGDFRQGQTGATYTMMVHNGGSGSTVGEVSVVDTLPAGLTATGLEGIGWTCDVATLTCTRQDALVAGAAFPAITLTVDVEADAPASLTNTATVSGGGELDPTNDTASDVANVIAVADLTLTKTHSGGLVQGQTGVVYTLTVTNSGPGDTTGEVSVTDAIPQGLALTGLSGSGWSCDLGTSTCVRSDVLAAGASYPAISVTVDVSLTAPTSVTNVAAVSGGGELETGNDSASDPATVAVLPDLLIGSSHADPFHAGQQGATYRLEVSNGGGGPTFAEVSVTDTLPDGLIATGMAGDGWSCTLATLTCTRADVLAAGAKYPEIVLTVDVAGSPAEAVNVATVSGGGEHETGNDTATDPTVVEAAPAQGCGCTETGGSADLAFGALALLALGLRRSRFGRVR